MEIFQRLSMKALAESSAFISNVENMKERERNQTERRLHLAHLAHVKKMTSMF